MVLVYVRREFGEGIEVSITSNEGNALGAILCIIDCGI
jgi:hypothetical protein